MLFATISDKICSMFFPKEITQFMSEKCFVDTCKIRTRKFKLIPNRTSVINCRRFRCNLMLLFTVTNMFEPQAKLRYDPVEIDPEDMCRMASEQPQVSKHNVVVSSVFLQVKGKQRHAPLEKKHSSRYSLSLFLFLFLFLFLSFSQRIHVRYFIKTHFSVWEKWKIHWKKMMQYSGLKKNTNF